MTVIPSKKGNNEKKEKMSQRRNRYLLAIIMLLVFFGCGSPEKKEEKKVVAVVNGKAILMEELQEEVARLGLTPGEDRKEMLGLKREMLNRMIERELILGEAERLGIKVSEEEIERRVRMLLSDYSQTELSKALEREEINFKKWKTKAREDLMIDKLIYIEIYSKVTVQDKEIEQYYGQHKEEFRQTKQVRALHIVVETEEEARRILRDLRTGKDFGQTARDKSTSPEAKKGGDLGFFSKGQMPQEFDDVVFKLKKGEISDIVRTPYGFHIFRMIDKRPGGLESLSDVREKVETKLIMQKQNTAFNRWFEDVKRRSEITINEEMLAEEP